MPEQTQRWPALLTRREAAEYLSVSETVLGQMLAAGEIRSVLVRGRVVRYRRDELDALIESLETANTAKFGPGRCSVQRNVRGRR